eukprot:12024248-Karenia_brevis.AAC.1
MRRNNSHLFRWCWLLKPIEPSHLHHDNDADAAADAGAAADVDMVVNCLRQMLVMGSIAEVQ